MLFTALLLSFYSLLVLFHITPELFNNQAIAVAVGFVLYFAVQTIDDVILRKLWVFIYIALVLTLIVTFWGDEVRGARRWIELGIVRIQLSELGKPFYAIVIAGFLSNISRYSLKNYFILAALCAVPALLVFEQPDLGNSIVYVGMFFGMLIVSPYGIQYVAIPIAMMIGGIPLLWHFLEEYQKLRLTTFLNPGYDMKGAGYNAYQAIIAVGSGWLLGKGLGEGTQSKLRFLPEFHTDFIFASTVEQLGFVGGFILIVLYIVLLVQIIRVALGGDRFVRLLAAGIAVQLFIQVFINIGMNIGIVPITGITLPLFSYGGSSVVATFISLGLLSRFKRRTHSPIAIR